MTFWNHTLITKVKSEVKAELDGLSSGTNSKQKSSYLQRQMQILQESLDSQDLLRLFVVIVSSLLQQKKSHFWSSNQIEKMVESAYKILQMQKISPEKSTLGYLYGEINLALSQLYRSSGDHFAAAWQQQLSHHLVKQTSPSLQSFQNLASGIRFFRLGQIPAAKTAFVSAIAGDLPRRQRELAQINLLRCMRILELDDQHHEESARYLQNSQIESEYWRELNWEVDCLQVARSGDLSTLVEKAKKMRGDLETWLLLEAILRSYADSKRRWRTELPKTTTLLRRKDNNLSAKDQLVRALKCLENCYDSSIPLVFRLRELGMILQYPDKFTSREYLWLFWVAASRWLAKSHAPDLAAMIFRQYRGDSFANTGGKKADVLRIAGDLSTRAWAKDI